MVTPFEVFCCYAREDQRMLVHLKKQLAQLERQGQIVIWSDTDLNAGIEWEKEIHKHLERADIILLLISPDFMASDYCYSTEMGRAITRHDAGSARVIPILLRPTFWESAPFAKLHIIPTNTKPVTKWPKRDDAFHDIIVHISRVVSELQTQRIQIQRAESHKEQQRHVSESELALLNKNSQQKPVSSLFEQMRRQRFAKRPEKSFFTLAVISIMVCVVSGISWFMLQPSQNVLLSERERTSTAEAAQVQNTQIAGVNTTMTDPLATQQNPYPPYTGTLMFNASLSKNTTNPLWEEGTDPDIGSCLFIGGAYHVEIVQMEQFFYCSDTSTTFTNFAYQVQMRILKGNQAGISFRAGASGSLYYFYIDTQGNYQLNLNENHNFIKTISQGSNQAIKTGFNQPNLIAVVAQGIHIDLYVNLHLIAHVSDATFSGGQIGMLAISIHSSTEATFTNAKVWKL